MTILLEEAILAVSLLPSENQDEIARMMLASAGKEGEPEEIPPEHLAAALDGLAQADRGEFATNEEVEEAFRRFRR